MHSIRGYLAEIGRRGGMKSRRTLSRTKAQAMVRAREARRAQQRAHAGVDDTSAATRTVYDRLLRQMTATEKLQRVAQLSRMVQELAAAGARMRA